MSGSMQKREHFMAVQKPIVKEIVNVAKSRGLKVTNNIENVVIYWPSSRFTAMISRLSHIYQFYLLGDGHNQFIGEVDSLQDADDFMIQAYEYKTRLEDGEVIREFVLVPDEDEEDPVMALAKQEEEYVAINVDTNEAKIFKSKQDLVQYLGCTRVSVDSALRGKCKTVRKHTIRKLA